jgi:glycosyltransferase involved in cell wall biosynthesis
LGSSDVFLIPSGNESFGLSALEAMACGVPVVSSDVGGLTELNVDGETGFVVPMGDVEMLAAKTLQILTDDVLQKRMSGRALAHARTDFTQDRIVKKYEDAYAAAMELAEV